jgi:ClpP class serine protease
MPTTSAVAPAAKEPPSSDPSMKYTGTPTFTDILNEANPNLDQLKKRQTLLTQIDDAFTKKYRAKNRTMTYLFRFGHPRAMMTSSDITTLEATLASISGADQINLLLQSPGGDGTIVEKMVEMCRAHLSGTKPKFRVIVPNIAKSAATVMALGADSIVMGYCSELGPIDPQVQIAVSGTIQYVSAFAFVDSRDKLMAQIAEAVANNTPPWGCSSNSLD